MHLIVRLGPDIVIKSAKVRARFIKQLIRNIKDGLNRAGAPGRIESRWSRLEIHDGDRRTIDVLRHVFGVASVAVVSASCSAESSEMLEHGVKVFGERVKGKTFAVFTKRSGSHPFTSMEFSKEMGARLYEGTNGVDLHHPEVACHVEVRGETCFFLGDNYNGQGGLPAGVGGRVLCLISGGFDSAIAALRMQKRGLNMDYMFCNLAGQSYERSVLKVAKYLEDRFGHGRPSRFLSVDFTEVSEEIRKKVKPSHSQVILKRMFYRAASQVCRKYDYEAIVTGECVGQVSSQTLQNLATISTAIPDMVMRPLIGYDKEEIIRLARDLGTFDLCAGIQEFCQLVPDKPVTACSVENAEFQEKDFDLSLIEKAIESGKSMKLRELDDSLTEYVFTDSIPEGARFIDCRSELEFEDWHPLDAVNIEAWDLERRFKQLDRKQVYVLYCPVGLQSAVAAEKMQNAGFQAYSFRGGVEKLKSAIAEKS